MNIIKKYQLLSNGINSLDLNPLDKNNLSNGFESGIIPSKKDLIKITFKSNPNPNEKAVILEYIQDISIDMMVGNILIGSKLNLKLKYSEGELNHELKTIELELINKYSNLDEKTRITDTIIHYIENLNTRLIESPDKYHEYTENPKLINFVKNFINR